MWGSICAGRKRGKKSRILREFTNGVAVETISVALPRSLV
jgi:hypothetical protein